ncbi:sensor histidine kinase [Cohnella cholangitidis]|uniref:histidine kinase n=1 Tax=Cohnella cholangitidis TaxID=2598458 RepID=A0A7G5C118_9BACL|nr:HAMP domain-containing sensor histidine kinase [Cohnella cholangitidis]QMV42902.1 HAMP domain-containing histidine kinase [Cohnella cholangitidis]
MPIRRRMLLSYTVMMLVSVLSILALLLTVAIAITGDWTGVRNLFDKQYALKPISIEEQNAFDEVRYLAKKTPDRLHDTELLSGLDVRLPSVQSGLIVREGDRILYATPALGMIATEVELPAYEMVNINVRGTWSADDRFFTYVKFDFLFPNQTPGSIYIVKQVSPYGEMTSEWFPAMIALLLILPLLVNGLLNYYVSRSIVNPLKELKRATDQIREGDLAFEVRKGSRDEIGQLFHSFEEMRRRLEQSVGLQLQYEENRKELLSNISHDLKTPITTIKGYVEGIRDGVANTPDKLDVYLSTIYSKAVAMDRLIDELFLFSKLDLGKVPFNFEKVNIGRYMEDLVEELEMDLAERGISIRYLPPHDGPLYAKVDRDKLKRAMFNITDNSVKYMDKPHKEILISMSARKRDEILVEVEDNGPGIEAEAVPHIFERFYRAEQSRSLQTGGSGLGLAIVKQIIHEHGGNIRATSREGEGTTISFTLKRMEGEMDS